MALTLPLADVVISLPVEEVEELPSGTYVWRIHYDSAAKPILAPITAIANAFIRAFEGVTGLAFIDLKGEDVAAGEPIPPRGYQLRWSDAPELTVIPYAHYDLVLTFKVSSPFPITTLIGLALIVLAAYIIWQIVSTILEKVPAAVIGIGGLAVVLLLLLALAPKRRE